MLKKTSGSWAHRLGAISRGVGTDGRVERVGQAVGDVGRDDERAHATLSAQHGRRRGDARLAHAALAGVQKDSGHCDLDGSADALDDAVCAPTAGRDLDQHGASGVDDRRRRRGGRASRRVGRQRRVAVDPERRLEPFAQPPICSKAAVIVILWRVAEALRRNVADDDVRPSAAHLHEARRDLAPGQVVVVDRAPTRSLGHDRPATTRLPTSCHEPSIGTGTCSSPSSQPPPRSWLPRT